jgi:hypothetical protein
MARAVENMDYHGMRLTEMVLAMAFTSFNP